MLNKNWKKLREISAAFSLALLFSSMTATLFVDPATANPYRYVYKGQVHSDGNTKPPVITILSPKINSSYPGGGVSLSFNVSVGDSSTASARWIGEIYYRADWQPDNVYVYEYWTNTSSGPPTHNGIFTDLSYNLNPTGTTNGPHNITVYASEMGQYEKPDPSLGFGPYGIAYYSFIINSSSTVFFTIDTISPTISILSLENKTYDTSDVPLSYVVDESASQISYVLDGQENVTISGNTTLTGLSDGTHNVTVYATDMAGNVGSTETVIFTVAKPTAAFPTAPVAAASVATVAIVCAGLLVYVRKRAHRQTVLVRG